MVVTVSPANADRTGYETNRMRSYLKCTHIEVVNVLSVLRNSEELFAHCPTLHVHVFLLCRATGSCSWLGLQTETSTAVQAAAAIFGLVEF